MNQQAALNRPESKGFDSRAGVHLEPLIPVPLSPSTAMTGEHALCVAILSDAFNLAVGKATERNCVVKQEAIAWFSARGTQPFGVQWLCDVLGVEYDALMLAVQRGEPPKRYNRVCAVRHQVNGKVFNGYTDRFYEEKPCEDCGGEFTPTGPRGRWCKGCQRLRRHYLSHQRRVSGISP